LALIPANASFVIYIDANAFRATPVYAQLIAPEAARIPELAAVTTACGFDPMPLVTSVTVAAMGGMADDGGLEVVVRGIPKDRALACLPTLRSQSFTLEQDRD